MADIGYSPQWWQRVDRNQILADLLVQFATDDRRTYFNMDRDGYTRLDGTLILTPEQMTALEDAILEHKAKEE
jgi:hypothetical protein